MKEVRIIGVQILDRIKESGRTQMVLTKYGHIIKTRFGFHELSEEVASRVGLIILELTGNVKEWDLLEKELDEIGGIRMKTMKFELS
jgi:hypothetical protein